jgi:hypothetical protein
LTERREDTVYFLDSSAVVKRYVEEVGTRWIEDLCDPSRGSAVVLSQITLVEVAAAFASKYRGGVIDEETYDQLMAGFLYDAQREYLLVPLNQAIVEMAIRLTRHHQLRAYDAVQLASALIVNRFLADRELGGLVFVSADEALIEAAEDEKLLIGNPLTASG